jgi:hypothetical protein
MQIPEALKPLLRRICEVFPNTQIWDPYRQVWRKLVPREHT